MHFCPPRSAALGIPLAALALLAGCSSRSRTVVVEVKQTPVSRQPARPAVYEAEVAEGLGASIMIVIDTSGSMKHRAKGDSRPKHVVAREAIEKMLTATEKFQRKNPEIPVRVGVMRFSSSVWRVLPIQPYSPRQTAKALKAIPKPAGGTAIGRAMSRARQELYRGGTYRKYMIVVTDGKNGSGPAPDRVAREIFQRSEGGVQFYFVAFDTDAKKFGFLKEVGGEVIPARNGKELNAALSDIYEGKILAEADYGETELYDPRKKGTSK